MQSNPKQYLVLIHGIEPYTLEFTMPPRMNRKHESIEKVENFKETDDLWFPKRLLYIRKWNTIRRHRALQALNQTLRF